MHSYKALYTNALYVIIIIITELALSPYPLNKGGTVRKEQTKLRGVKDV